MRIISKKALRLFWGAHPPAEGPLKAWHSEARPTAWTTPANIKEKYGNASVLKDGRVVFNIAGNKYRLVVRINYEVGIVYIRFVGTHAQYDKIDAETV